MPFFQTGVVVTHDTAAKNSPAVQKAFSPYAATIKETSVKLLTGHLELQTSLIMTFYYEFLTHGDFVFFKTFQELRNLSVFSQWAT